MKGIQHGDARLGRPASSSSEHGHVRPLLVSLQTFGIALKMVTACDLTCLARCEALEKPHGDLLDLAAGVFHLVPAAMTKKRYVKPFVHASIIPRGSRWTHAKPPAADMPNTTDHQLLRVRARCAGAAAAATRVLVPGAT